VASRLRFIVESSSSNSTFMNDAAYAGRPSVCRSCGALVGAGENTCAQCGAPLAAYSPETKPRMRLDRETLHFARAILKRPATFTFVFLIANIFLFLLTWGEGNFQENSPEFHNAVILYGAKLNDLINAGQWWRFVTPIFLHGGIIHLLMNMYGLWVLGPYVERLYGSAKFVVFWVLTGIAGVVASYLAVRPEWSGGILGRFLFKSHDGPSVGASGAIFGLIGVLFVFGIKFRRELPEGFKRAFGTGMLPIILLNLFIGFIGSGFIDNAAHMGGLVAGVALALVVNYKRPGPRGPVATFWHVLQVGALLLVALCFAIMPLKFGETQQLVKRFTVDSSAYLETLNQGSQALDKLLTKGETNALEPALKRVDETPRLDAKADELLQGLKLLLIRARELSANWDGMPKEDAQAQMEKLASDFKDWVKRRNEWVKTDGAQYDFHLKESDPSNNSSDKK
jgi:rhomboid protease GluP